MRKGLITTTMPKWKVREYTRLIIGIIMVTIIVILGLYTSFFMEYQKIAFLRWLFG